MQQQLVLEGSLHVVVVAVPVQGLEPRVGPFVKENQLVQRQLGAVDLQPQPEVCGGFIRMIHLGSKCKEFEINFYKFKKETLLRILFK